MNAVMEEIEMMDPVDFWAIHRNGWHTAGDTASYCHLPNYSQFCYELEEAATYVLDQFGVNYN
jgi:hypothetical protein